MNEISFASNALKNSCSDDNAVTASEMDKNVRIHVTTDSGFVEARASVRNGSSLSQSFPINCC